MDFLFLQAIFIKILLIDFEYSFQSKGTVKQLKGKNICTSKYD